MIDFKDCFQTAETGNPTLPYFPIKLLLPQGTKAEKITITGENLIPIDGEINLCPHQASKPLSFTGKYDFIVNQEIYSKSTKYPEKQEGRFETQFMNGYAVCLSTFTPVVYNPKDQKAAYYKKVTVEISYSSDSKSTDICQNVKKSEKIIDKVSRFVQNSNAINTYRSDKSTTAGYDVLIVTGSAYVSSFSNLVNFYAQKGLTTEVKSMTDIYAVTTGVDNAEKLRNYIISEYNTNNISYVILAGDVEIVPYRGFYCHVLSGGDVYEDDNIPSDLYYSSLDGTWNNNGDSKWGEIGEDDLLPEVAVGRLPFSNATELTNMLNKTLKYQQNPILGELDNPLLAGEYLYGIGTIYETWGSDYLNLLIGHHTDNGYETTGIPALSPLDTLYEENGWNPSNISELLAEINSGHPFIYHSGHANDTYVMGFSSSDITNSNFSQVNGTTHNYTFLYTHGCICGAFDDADCIAEEMLKIQNFLAGFIGNSRYGWFNEGTTEGPSAHIQREFIDALYQQKISNIGMAHLLSKQNTAVWVNAPGQWEEGALRWCFYDCNTLADPVLSLWTADPQTVSATFNSSVTKTDNFNINVKVNGANAENYTCSVFQGTTMIGKGITDADGNVNIAFDQITVTSGSATLIVSGYNISNTQYSFEITAPSSAAEVSDKFRFQIFPNPFTNSITINYELTGKESVKTELFDIYGKSLKIVSQKETHAGQNTFKIDLSDLPNGVYFYKITIGNQAFEKRIVKI